MTTFNDPLEALAKRAAADPDFRADLLAQPRAAVEAETGMQVPDDWNIVVTESPDGAVHIGFLDDELPEDYLDLVSGGGSGCGLGGLNTA